MSKKSEVEQTAYSYTAFLKDFWNILGSERRRFVFWYLVRLFSSLIDLLPFYAVGRIVDILVNDSNGSQTRLYFWLGIILAAIVAAIYTRLRSKFYIGDVNRVVRRTVRLDAMGTFLSQSLKDHEQEGSGNKVQRVNTGINGINVFIGFLSTHSTDIVSGIFGVGIFFLSLGWYYMVVLVLYILLYFSYEYRMNCQYAEHASKKNIYFEKVSGNFHEVTTNIATVKAMGMQAAIHEKARQYEHTLAEIERRLQTIGNKKWVGIQMISAIFFTSILFLGMQDIQMGTISIGLLVVLASYARNTQGSLNIISRESENVIDAKCAIQRIRSLLSYRSLDTGSRKIPADWKEIRFNAVSFKYNHTFVLENVTFALRRGEKLGIVGVSGQGKSTILKLLLRLYEPTKGTITIDGIDIREYSLQSLSKLMTIVPQDVELFNLSVKENIEMMGSEGEIGLKKSLQIALCVPIIKKLPQGINTVIGEKGFKLSGGEKQRIGIARAIYMDSDILLLDESTSHLDSKTEYQIQKNINTALKEKTLIAVAHRFSTLRNVDRILVLGNGTVEEGTYDELYQKKGIFYSLVQLQRK